MKKILFVAVHPDDETLGCGGTIIKHKANGDEIYWLIITNISEKYKWDKKKVNERQQEINEVAELYNFDETYKLDFPTMRLDEIPTYQLINSISDKITAIKPDVIYLPNRSDIHTDHQITFKAALSCIKNFRTPFIERILMYEVMSETEFSPALPENSFIPNVFIDISEYLRKKLRIMELFKTELMEEYYPRSLKSIEALARFRGSRIGVNYAEAFMLLFEKS